MLKSIIAVISCQRQLFLIAGLMRIGITIGIQITKHLLVI